MAALLATAAAPSWTAARAQSAVSAYRTEIIVRAVRNLRTPADVRTLVERAAHHRVSVINVAAKQDEDDEIASGLVFYASAIAPRAPGYESFDVLAETIGAAHRLGMKVRAWVPQFHDQIAARQNPSWQMQAAVDGKAVPFTGNGRREFFVNPLDAGVQAYERSIVAEIARGYAVDGIVLDWVRFDDYNMDVGPATRARFEAAFGFDPLAIDFKADTPQRRQWNAWRTAGIAAYMRGVREALDAARPGLVLGAYILPPEFVEVGQDAALFAGDVSFLSPMAYYNDWGFAPDWTVDRLLPQTLAKAGQAEVIPVLDEDWSDTAYRETASRMRRDFSGISPLSWFAYGQWTEASFRRLDRLRDS
ncbi:MAG: family 10 glycosylhydrolase [Reyranella sp.]|nr:family 10 glycosylhydrolase [Reyranella sp.]